MSTEETNKAAKRSYFEAFKAHDLSIFDRRTLETSCHM